MYPVARTAFANMNERIKNAFYLSKLVCLFDGLRSGQMGRASKVILMRNQNAMSIIGEAMSQLPLWAIFSAAVLIRVVLLPMPGYSDDMRDFSHWMFALVSIGPHGIYADTSGKLFSVVDYPPGYLYVLWGLGEVYRFLFHGFDNPVLVRAWLKLPSVIADFGVAIGVMRLARLCRPTVPVKAIAATLLLGPMLWLDSAYWGQVDSVAALAAVWMLVATCQRRFLQAWVLLAIAVLLKPQIAVVVPLFVSFAYINDRKRINLVIGPFIAGITAYLLALPFAPSAMPLSTMRWLLQRYFVGVGKSPNNTSGAFNLYAAFMHLYVSDGVRHAGITLHTLGLILFGAALIAVLARAVMHWRANRADQPDSMNMMLVFSSLMTIAAMFLLATRMHERYMMIAVVLLPLLAGYGRRMRLATYAAYAIFSANLLYVLLQVHGSPSHGAQLLLVHALSLINLFAYGIFSLTFFGVTEAVQTRFFSLAWFKESRYQAVLVGATASIIAFLSGGRHETEANNYVYLAQAILQGHAWIHWPGPRIDALLWHGRYYVIEAPVPALLLLPFVAVFGLSAHQSLLGVILVGVAIGAGWSLLKHLNAPLNVRSWLTAFLFAGTDLWWCSTLGDVWLIAHLGAVAATLLTLRELFSQRRGWLVGLFACAAVGCRFSLIAALPVYALMLLQEHLATEAINDRPRLNPAALLQRLLPFSLVVIAGLVLWVSYNQVRWHTINDIGYNEWYKQDSFGSGGGSPFQLRFFWYEFRSFFLALPVIVHHRPWLVAPWTGQGLLFTSPALALAFFSRGNATTRTLLWAATLLVGIPSLIYYANGFAQFGMRHALDFEPFLFALMGLASMSGIRLWAKMLCAYSITIGIWGIICWHVTPRWI